MRESTTYQAILKEGRNEGIHIGREIGREEGEIIAERRVLIRQGTIRFGKPDASTQSRLELICVVERLEELAERIIKPDIVDWNSLLQDA